MSKLYLGIDPGGSGSMAFLPPTGALWCVNHTETPHDLSEALRDARRAYNGDISAVLERVSAMPGQGVTSMFSFGKSFGISIGLLTAHNIPYELVTPQKWQKEFSLPTTKAAGTKTAKKNFHKARAQELYPEASITHANADAILLATYAKREGM
jgi:crossover junction endodeoxyribonuclease RuvC